MKRNYIPLAVFVAGVLVLGVFFTLHNNTNTPAAQIAATTTSATTTGGNPTTTQDTGSATIPAPNLNRPQTFAATVSPDVVAQLKVQEKANITALEINSGDINSWLELAIDYKIAGDYQGAEAIWIYLTKVIPQSYIPYANLGDLYTSYLKNNAKAEADYKQSIVLNPSYIDNYRNLYYLYMSEGNTTAALGVLAQGLKANPADSSLLALQAQTKTQ